jgi:hypothetical protein
MALFLRRSMVLRAAIGLGSAYVLALQVFLAAVISTDMAVAQAANPSVVICYGHNADAGENGSGGKQVTHQSCAICVFASSTPPLPSETAHPALSSVVFAAFTRDDYSAPAPSGRRDPRTSQGPPQAA